MYRFIWNMINKLSFERKIKHSLFLVTTIVIFALLGTLMWFLFGRRIFGDNIHWLICFIGYPALILGYFLAVLALFKLDQ